MTSKGGMSPVTRLVLDKLYAQAAGVPQRLPWHDETPSPLLIKGVEGRGRQGRALDVGCGSGIFAAFLAKEGMQWWPSTSIPRQMAEREAVDAAPHADGLAGSGAASRGFPGIDCHSDSG